MTPTIGESIDELAAVEWDRLNHDRNPFIRHAFLAALEHHGAVGGNSGWQPRYLTIRDNGQLIAAAPLYLKSHSFGEFVFDWAWADAYQRAGLSYYPKLVIASPYSPVSGARLLMATDSRREELAALINSTLLDYIQQYQLSSVHCLFTTTTDQHSLLAQNWLARHGCQFHWHNDGYYDFDDFLQALTSKSRRKIRHERKRINQQQLTVTRLAGAEISSQQWQFFHQCYQATFDKKMNFAPLSLEFFIELGQQMPADIVLIIAQHRHKPVASALFFRNQHTLYGRYWGCLEHFDRLHFELCYYQAIEYCIEHRLQRCEAGAQGEHKLARGFIPTLTRSAHWIIQPQFRAAISEFLAHERQGMAQYREGMLAHSPYKTRLTTAK